ncbi:MAG: ATP-dependent helicase [Burkholderiales bacterium]|nr:ATP-dependent helicase [Burkholderiales bacterium]
MNSIDAQQRQSSAARRRIRLSTIEDAKGLEFRHVFIPDCNSQSFDGTSQDERNLFYVAASRARDNLVISYKKGASSTYLKHFM